MVCILSPIRGDDQILDAHIQPHGGAGGGELRNIYFGTADGDKELPAAGDGDGGIQDAALDCGRCLGLYLAQLGQLNCPISDRKAYL